jgi:hypothetical protein
MKKTFFSVVILVMAAALSHAQSPAATSANPAEMIAPGSLIPAELTKSVDAKKAKQGDPVQARTSQELLSQDGHVMVPLGAKIEGHITEAKPHEKGESTSTLGVVFDKIVFKDGHEVPMNAMIQALAPPLSSMNANSDAISQPGAPGSSPSQQPSGGMYGGMSRPAGSSPAENPNGGSMGQGGSGNAGNAPGGTGNGRLSANAQGVVGISGLSLQGEVLTSQKKNVKLDNGTQLMLRVANRQ